MLAKFNLGFLLGNMLLGFTSGNIGGVAPKIDSEKALLLKAPC